MLDDAVKLARMRKACRRGRYDFDEIVADCRAGRAQLLETPNAVAVTSLLVSGPYRVCYVILVAGTLEGVAEMGHVIEQHARNAGCQYIRTVGRPGFSKKAPDIDPSYIDYKPVGIMYEKEVGP